MCGDAALQHAAECRDSQLQPRSAAELPEISLPGEH